MIAQFTSDAWFVVLNAILLIGMGTLFAGAIGIFLTIWHWSYGAYVIILKPSVISFQLDLHERSQKFFAWLATTKVEAFKRREPEGATQ